MKVIPMKTFLLSALLLSASALALAAADPQQLLVRDILTQQTQLRSEVVAGKGAFKDMSKADRQVLTQRQDQVLQILGGLQDFDELAPDQRVVVFNDLEWIKAAVTKAEDERMICEYTRSVGSNRMKSVCVTAKEQRELREGSQQSLRSTYKCDGCIGN
jgi:hypothetical protein